MSIPIPFSPLPTSSGTASPSRRAVVTPLKRSSLVNFSPEKYFSIKTSSEPATTSAISSYILSVALTWSWLSSVSCGAEFTYLYPFWKITSVTPTKCSPSPIGTEKGITFLPKEASSSSISFLKFTFSPSILFIKIILGRPIFSVYFQVLSVPTSMPLVASITIIAASLALRAPWASPTKSR